MKIVGSENERKTVMKAASLPRVIGLMSLGATAFAVALLPSHSINPLSLTLMLAGLCGAVANAALAASRRTSRGFSWFVFAFWCLAVLYVSGRLMAIGWLAQP